MYVWRKYVYKEKEESKYIVERKREENAADNIAIMTVVFRMMRCKNEI